MQRTTIYRDDPWDQPVPVGGRDRRDSDQQLPKCPLPMMRRTTRRMMRVDDDMDKISNSTDTTSPSNGSGSSNGKYQTIDKNFRKSYARSTSATTPEMPNNLYPDLNITAQRLKVAKALANTHRQRSKRWQLAKQQTNDESGRPEVTSPQRSKAVDCIEQCLQEQQRRAQNLIPPTLTISRRGSDVSGYVDDDQSTLSQSRHHHYSNSPLRPKPQQQEAGYWAPPTPQEPISGDKNAVPSALDKSSVKRLAAHHRTSVCGASLSSPNSSGHPLHRSNSTGSDYTPPPRIRSSGSPLPRRSISTGEYTPPPRRGSPLPPRSNSTGSSIPAEVTRPSQRAPPVMVEICPGLSAPLRGSDETLKAVASRFYTDVSCFGCCAQIHCIADVQYTICPHCRVISPLEEDRFQGERLTVRWGLGLGFTKENLWTMQADLAASSRNNGSY